MDDKGNGRGTRISDLYGSDAAGKTAGPPDLTPDEARALIDGFFRRHGLDPGKATDPSGWRHLSLGSANGQVGVIEWRPGEYHLVVSAPILQVEVPTVQLGEFYRLLLELNHGGTSVARFSLHGNVVHVSLSRPIRGLDQNEVDDAIRAVMAVADGYDERVADALDILVGDVPVPLSELPKIKLTPDGMQRMASILGSCDSHGRAIFRYLMERWDKAGYEVNVGKAAPSLDTRVGSNRWVLAVLQPVGGERRQLISFGWKGLSQFKAFPPEAVARFQAEIARIAEPHVQKSTAHVWVNDAFSKDQAKAFLRVLKELAASIGPEAPPPKPEPEWPETLPRPNIQAGNASLTCIRDTLLACEQPVQDLYVRLMEGWNGAGGAVHCSRAGRIYLKFRTKEHMYGRYGMRSHQFSLAVLAAPKGKRGASIVVAWDLASGEFAYLDYAADQVARFEAVVSGLPGFERKGATTSLRVGETFKREHAETLLHAMWKLQEAAGAGS